MASSDPSAAHPELTVQSVPAKVNDMEYGAYAAF